MKKLTNRQMWLHIADLFKKKTEKDCFGDLCIVTPRYRCFGICRVLEELRYEMMITRNQKTRAINLIHAEHERLGSINEYLWSFDKEGTNERVKFAKRMANKYKPKVKTVKQTSTAVKRKVKV